MKVYLFRRNLVDFFNLFRERLQSLIQKRMPFYPKAVFIVANDYRTVVLPLGRFQMGYLSYQATEKLNIISTKTKDLVTIPFCHCLKIMTRIYGLVWIMVSIV